MRRQSVQRYVGVPDDFAVKASIRLCFPAFFGLTQPFKRPDFCKFDYHLHFRLLFMRKIMLLMAITASTALCQAQSIVGRWQLVNQSNCVEDELGASDDDTQALVDDMKSLSGSVPQILEFKSNSTGEESAKIISKKKSYNSRSFMYRYNDSGLYFLDKKSKTIIEGYTVEKLDTDSLIISNSSRVCETKIFVRVK